MCSVKAKNAKPTTRSQHKHFILRNMVHRDNFFNDKMCGITNILRPTHHIIKENKKINHVPI